MGSSLVRQANLYGAGGIGLVLAEALADSGWRINRIFDDAATPGARILGTAVEPRPPASDLEGQNDVATFISIGDAATREGIVRSMGSSVRFDVGIHPSAQVSPTADIGLGSMVFHRSVIQARAQIGQHVIVNTAASIDHDCIVSDFAHIAPHATLCGLVVVGERTEIGAGAAVIPSIRIGRDCRIGAGAVIIRDVPDGATVVGNPGRVIRTK